MTFPSTPPSTIENEEPRASTSHRVRAIHKTQGQSCRWSKIKTVFIRLKRFATTVVSNYIVYIPNVAECVKQNCSNPKDVFLLMYPPTLRDITFETSNLYSTQTMNEELYLCMDKLLTFYGILITFWYTSVPRRHMHWTLMYTMKAFKMQCGEIALMKYWPQFM